MASGRVGGTKSKVSGQIGSEIYQIVRNNDGTYSQVVMAKGVKTVTTITERGRAQQMCTAMVESLMNELKAIGSISFQSGANKSKSLNAFSSFNLRRVADDCKANWYGNANFFYPEWGQDANPGGLYILSSGTLNRDMFDSVVAWFWDWHLCPPFSPDVNRFAGLMFTIPKNATNVGDLLRIKGWNRRDTCYFVWQHERYRVYDNEDTRVEFVRHDYIAIGLNPTMSDSKPLNEENLRALFITQSKENILFRYDDETNRIWIGRNDIYFDDDSDYEDLCAFLGGFSIMYGSGKKQISSHNLQYGNGEAVEFLEQNNPSKVFRTWMTGHRGAPWPSPFIQQNQ